MKKTVLITGSSSGFGKLATKTFHDKGWNVIATMRSPQKETELGKLKNVLLTKMDVTDRQSVQEAINQGIEQFGRIDVLVNNAGYGAVGYLEEADDMDISKQMDTNFTGVVYCIQEVLPQMRKQNSGVIINITSLAGTCGFPFHSLYNASKFAVEGLSESLKFELEPFGIQVKTIAPGAFRTGFSKGVSYTVGNAKKDLKESSQKFQKCYAEILEEPPKPFGYGDAQVVADLIYKCATEKTPNKNFVGKDAKSTIMMRKLMPKSSYNKMIKNALLPK
jgi:NAD(P)-dependent dehydrogenase (short-subunit alcohol dehydrogenase family)